MEGHYLPTQLIQLLMEIIDFEASQFLAPHCDHTSLEPKVIENKAQYDPDRQHPTSDHRWNIRYNELTPMTRDT